MVAWQYFILVVWDSICLSTRSLNLYIVTMYGIATVFIMRQTVNCLLALPMHLPGAWLPHPGRPMKAAFPADPPLKSR